MTRACRICGGSIRSDNKVGICRRNPECWQERNRLYQAGWTAANPNRVQAHRRKYYASLSAERRARKTALAKAASVMRPELDLVKHARDRAKLKGIPCTITTVDVVVPCLCPCCGVPMERGNGVQSKNSPSIDCYDAALGYIPGNVMVICHDCNRRKQDHTGEELIKLGEAIIAAKTEYDRLAAHFGPIKARADAEYAKQARKLRRA